MTSSTDAREHWSRLETLVHRLAKSPRGQDPDHLREFWTLYRGATSRLATLRSAGRANEEEYYLNRLVGAAHALLYRRRSPGGALRRMVRFFVIDWPESVREHARLVAIATAIFVLGGLSGAFYAATDPGFLPLVASSEVLAGIEAGEMWTSGILSIQPAASSLIFSNNLTVAILAFALGVTAGLGTVWILFMNGASFGTLTFAVIRRGMAGDFFGFVAPHGVLELPAIFIAGAAGLALGRGILFPGDRMRGRSVVLAARGAVRLAVGCGPLLLVAAALEAWVSPEPYSLPVKLGTGALLALALAAYLLTPAGIRPPR